MMNDALRLVRVFHDMSQKTAAEKLGLSKSYVSEIENNRKKVSMETLERYSSAFNIPMSSLMLFAEQHDQSSKSDDVRLYIADKVLKMLDWISAISDDDDKMHA